MNALNGDFVMKSYKSLIFLDIDGVMTSTLETPGSYLNHIGDEYGISPKCFERLKKLCFTTDSKVIVSSNWRRFAETGSKSYWLDPFNKQLTCNPLPKLKEMLGDLFLGTLPLDRHCSKSQALELWFEDNNINESSLNYVIFDDDISEGFIYSRFHKHFILTDAKIGLSDNDCKKALTILNTEIRN